MFIVDETTGDITLRQGDSGVYTLTDLEIDYEFTPYLAVIDNNYKQIAQITGEKEYIDGKYSITFKFKPSFTDKLVVKKGEEEASYMFGAKISSGVDDIEETLIIGNKDGYGENIITVLPKIVEG